MTTTAPVSENQTFTITEEIAVRAPLEQTFGSLVAQMGRLNEAPDGTPLPMILEPHPGEAARLLKITTIEVQSDRAAALRKLSKQCGNCWVVLKGHQTLIGRSKREVFVNSSGNPFLAQGGSGDALAGYLGGLLAQPQLLSDPSRTIRYGVWQHGASADALSGERTNWTVENLVDALGNRRK